MIDISPVRGRDVPSQDHRKATEATPSLCRALVPLSPAAPREPLRAAPAVRSSAPFLAQLIATAEGLPQTREKRRLEPDVATHVYAMAQAHKPLRTARLASL